jgi:hypothetical protein
MMDRRFALPVLPVLLWVLLTGSPASAGLFGKKTKPTPAEHVPELIKTLKTDGDEHKRCSAAEELREYDPSQFPDMIPALIDAVLNDKKPAVRAEAAQSLGKLRPVTPAAGAALEQALAKDGSMRVRLQARSSLLQYRWAGYSPKPANEPPPQSKEPPLAPELPAPAASAPRPVAVPAASQRLMPVPATPAPTLPATPRPAPVAIPVSRPLPVGPDAPASQSSTSFSLSNTTKSPEEKGPDLTPP